MSQGSNSQNVNLQLQGPMHWTAYAMDTFAAPLLSELNKATIAGRTEAALRAHTWLAGFALRSLFVATPVGNVAKLGFKFVRRSAATIRCYESARIATEDFLASHNTQAPALSKYALAVDHWEALLSQAVQALKCLSGMGSEKLQWFQKGDCSACERLYGLRDDSTHAEARVSSGETQAESAFTIWMAPEGLRSKNHHVTWVELSELVDELASCVDVLLRSRVTSESAPPE